MWICSLDNVDYKMCRLNLPLLWFKSYVSYWNASWSLYSTPSGVGRLILLQWYWDLIKSVSKCLQLWVTYRDIWNHMRHRYFPIFVLHQGASFCSCFTSSHSCSSARWFSSYSSLGSSSSFSSFIAVANSVFACDHDRVFHERFVRFWTDHKHNAFVHVLSL